MKTNTSLKPLFIRQRTNTRRPSTSITIAGSGVTEPTTVRRKVRPTPTRLYDESQVLITSPPRSTYFFTSRRPQTKSVFHINVAEPENTDQRLDSSNLQDDQQRTRGETLILRSHLKEISGQEFLAGGLTARRPLPTTTTPRPYTNTIQRLTTPTPKQSLSTTKFIIRKRRPDVFDKLTPSGTFKPFSEYDYYDDEHDRIVSDIPEHSKVLIDGNGQIHCLDQGNFPHPVSCKKFISCAKMEHGRVLGWEYTCPKNLSFDPVGGICNWAAGLGCKE